MLLLVIPLGIFPICIETAASSHTSSSVKPGLSAGSHMTQGLHHMPAPPPLFIMKLHNNNH